MYTLCHSYKCWNAVSSGGLVGLSTNSTDFCWTKQTICERESVFVLKQRLVTAFLFIDEHHDNSSVCTLLIVWMLHHPRRLVLPFLFHQHHVTHQHLENRFLTFVDRFWIVGDKNHDSYLNYYQFVSPTIPNTFMNVEFCLPLLDFHPL